MGQNVKEHLVLALRMMLKPLVKLLVSQGVSHGDFSDAAKDVFVEVAIRHFDQANRVNQSRVAILTGLIRMKVKNVIDRAASAEPHGKNHSRPSRVLAGWHSDPKYIGPYGVPLEIPYESAGADIPAFVDLVKTYSGDMAPRPMLKELIRVGAVIQLPKNAVMSSNVHAKQLFGCPFVLVTRRLPPDVVTSMSPFHDSESMARCSRLSGQGLPDHETFATR